MFCVSTDTIEFFIAPRHGGNSYLQFIVGAGGGWFEKKVSGRFKDSEWTAPWKHAVNRGEKGWTAEVAVPLYLFGSPLSTMGFNAARNRKGSQKEYLTWALNTAKKNFSRN